MASNLFFCICYKLNIKQTHYRLLASEQKYTKSTQL